MSIDNNRRLREVKKEIQKYQKRLDESTTISDCMIYQGKIDSLEREKNEIIKRYTEVKEWVNINILKL